MITDVDLKEKVVKLMSMAGTEGDAYCEWTVNQIVHGLREAVVGATPDRVTVAVETLIDEGLVKKKDLESGKPQFVLVKKMPPPEPLQESPVVVQVEKGVGKTGHASGLAEPPIPVVEALQRRVDNLEEVMAELNRQVSGLKEEFKETRQKAAGAVTREVLSEVRIALSQRVGKCEIQLEGLEQRHDGLTKLIEKAVDATVDELTDDGVQVEDDELVVRVKELIGEWEATARNLVNRAATRPEAAVNEGAAKALRGCAVSLRNALDGTREQWRDDAEPSDLALTLARVLADHFDGLYGPFGNPMRRRTKTS